MPLIFPNRSRSFDDNRKVVRFSGYDGMLEVRFLIEATALRSSQQPSRSETECLDAFDAARGVILEAASHAYSRRRRKSYVLTAEDIQR
jgi:hypothetical protein